MTTQLSFELLTRQFSRVSKKSLWVLDENPPLLLPTPNTLIDIISNRYDVVESMQARGYNAQFSDFCFDTLDAQSYQNIFFRISKEKAVAHHVMNSARKLLSKDGQLIISGAKQEGIKGYIDRGKQLYTIKETLKGDKQHWGAIFERSETIGEPLDDKQYAQLRPIEKTCNNLADFQFLSKPGVFGWNKIDAGSALLVSHLAPIYNTTPWPKTVLDIGCGYGYLSVACAKLLNSAVVACDNNAAAIQACRANLDTFDTKHQVIATNCTQQITTKFDLVICNPPFHTGFSVENDLTDQFLNGAKSRLAEGGIALFVVNLHIPLERKAKLYFKNISTLSDDKHFKIIRLDNN